jgi:hypothetical protein
VVFYECRDVCLVARFAVRALLASVCTERKRVYEHGAVKECATNVRKQFCLAMKAHASEVA